MVFFEQCTPDQLKKLYEGFGATEETVERDIQSLKEWLEKQPHLPNVKDERIMRLILIRSKNSLEKTKRFLETYYILKARYHDIFARADPTSETFKRYYKSYTHLPLPKLMPDLSRVFIVYYPPPNENESINDSEEFVCYGLSLNLIAPVIGGVQKQFITIIDFKNMTFSMMSFFMVNLQRLTALSNIMGRSEKMYLVNSSAYVEPIFKLGRQISKKIFQDRVVVWKKDEKDLSEVIPKEYLPYEYGGTLGSRDELRDLFLKEMELWKDWLTEESKIYADLSKLPEDMKELIEVGQFGVEGSFRKLELE